MTRKRLSLLLAGLTVVFLAVVTFLVPGSAGPDQPSPRQERTEGQDRRMATPESAAPVSQRELPLIDVRVLDLEDGAPAVGAEFLWRGRGMDQVVRSRPLEDGAHLRVPGCVVRQLVPVGDFWRIAAVEQEDSTEKVTIWVYRMIHVSVLVHGTDGQDILDPTTVDLRAEIPGEGGLPGHSRSVRPWTGHWMRRHGVLPVSDLPRLNSDGTAEVSLPAVSGLVLTALSPGWRRASARVRIDPPHTPSSSVELRLGRRSQRIEGVVVDSEGAPVTGTPVRLYVSRYVPAAGLVLDDLRLPDCGLTAVVDEGKGVARLNWVMDTVSSGTASARPGAFSFDVEVEGLVRLVVVPAGVRQRLARRDFGSSGESVSGVRIVVDSLDRTPTVRICSKGKPLEGAILAVGDVTDEQFETSFRLVANASGDVAANLFEIGRRYSLLVRWRGKPKRIMRAGTIWWNGQSEIDVSTLK